MFEEKVDGTVQKENHDYSCLLGATVIFMAKSPNCFSGIITQVAFRSISGSPKPLYRCTTSCGSEMTCNRDMFEISSVSKAPPECLPFCTIVEKVYNGKWTPVVIRAIHLENNQTSYLVIDGFGHREWISEHCVRSTKLEYGISVVQDLLGRSKFPGAVRDAPPLWKL